MSLAGQIGHWIYCVCPSIRPSIFVLPNVWTQYLKMILVQIGAHGLQVKDTKHSTLWVRRSEVEVTIRGRNRSILWVRKVRGRNRSTLWSKGHNTRTKCVTKIAFGDIPQMDAHRHMQGGALTLLGKCRMLHLLQLQHFGTYKKNRNRYHRHFSPSQKCT